MVSISGTVKVAEVPVAKKGNLWKILVPVLLVAASIIARSYASPGVRRLFWK